MGNSFTLTLPSWGQFPMTRHGKAQPYCTPLRAKQVARLNPACGQLPEAKHGLTVQATCSTWLRQLRLCRLMLQTTEWCSILSVIQAAVFILYSAARLLVARLMVSAIMNSISPLRLALAARFTDYKRVRLMRISIISRFTMLMTRSSSTRISTKVQTSRFMPCYSTLRIESDASRGFHCRITTSRFRLSNAQTECTEIHDMDSDR